MIEAEGKTEPAGPEMDQAGRLRFLSAVPILTPANQTFQRPADCLRPPLQTGPDKLRIFAPECSSLG
jgi:hypothetical protein